MTRNELIDQCIAALESRYKVMTHSGSSNTYRRHLVGYIKELERLKDGPPIAAPASQPTDDRELFEQTELAQKYGVSRYSGTGNSPDIEYESEITNDLWRGWKMGRAVHYARQPDAAAIRNQALEAAAQAMLPMLRSMISRGEAAEIIRALATQSNEPAQQEPQWPFAQDVKPSTEEHKRRMELGRALGTAELAAPTAQQAGQPAPAVPEGFVLVPKEPTQEMHDAAEDDAAKQGCAVSVELDLFAVIRAAIAAAAITEQKEGGGK